MSTAGKDDPSKKFVKDIVKRALRHESVPSKLGFGGEWIGKPDIKLVRPQHKSEQHTLVYKIDISLETNDKKLKDSDKVWVTVRVRRNPDYPRKGEQWIPDLCTFFSKRHDKHRITFAYVIEDGQVIATRKR